MTGYYNIYEEYGLKHYQLPKIFFTNENYKKMNSDTKIAWAILRDRFSLSAKNGWYDDMGNIYFIFTNEELKELLGISDGKLYKVKQELIKNNLLEQKQMGLSKPNRLYLKKPIVTAEDVYKIEEQEKEPENPYKSTDTQKMRVKTLKKRESRHSKNESQDTQKMSTSNTDSSNTDSSNTDSSNHHHLIGLGFTTRQAKLIHEFAVNNDLKADDDDFQSLVGHLMEYKPNSLKYIAMAYDTLMNQDKKITVQKRENRNELNNLKKYWENERKKQEEEEQKKSPGQLDQERKELKELLNSYRENTN